MAEPERDEAATLRKRLRREQKARREAESIAERVTGELYTSARELQRLNLELKGANEELQTLNQAMRDFVAIASHDLRTPLTSILGATSTLVRAGNRLAGEQRSEFLAIIDRQARHLARMVEDLLTVSRIEAGALDTRREVVALSETLDRVVKDFEQHAAEIQTSGAHLAVLVDPDHLERMLVNFVGNAIKYDAPPVVIDARDTGEWVEIRVRDHGKGVPEEFVPRLFGKFARGDAARTQGGTGLGLSIVHGLAHANGGDTWYEPNEPEGSCFAVRLPKAS